MITVESYFNILKILQTNWIQFPDLKARYTKCHGICNSSVIFFDKQLIVEIN